MLTIGLASIILLYILSMYLLFSGRKQVTKDQDEFRFTSLEMLEELEKRIDNLPSKLLESINGSISSQKGKLGELIAYLSLKGSYDKVIPLSGIVDFIGLRFEKPGQEPTMDFIDIKNGHAARLSNDQKALAKLIKNNQIHFIKVNINTQEVNDYTGSNS